VNLYSDEGFTYQTKLKLQCVVWPVKTLVSCLIFLFSYFNILQ